MGDFFNALLGADFPKLCLVSGLMLLAIAIFCHREVIVGPIRLPKIDVFGRVLACVFGIGLIIVPVMSFYTGSTIGLVRPSQERPSISLEKHSFWLIQEAYAQGQGTLLQTINIEQRHIIKLGDNIGSGDLYLYVSNIHLKEPNDLIIYRARPEYLSDLKEGEEIEYKNILSKLKNDDIVLKAKVKEGVEIFFNYNGTSFKLRVSKVIWYIFGSDFMEIQISSV